MKFNFTLSLFWSGLLLSASALAQDINTTLGGGEHQVINTPCLTDAQRANVLQDIKSNILQLRSQNRLAADLAPQRPASTLFSWPVKMKDGLPYNEVWAISNYVDHNPAYPNKVQDYNCGTKTYDTDAGYNHMGVDIFTWPFSWKMMDYDEAEIVAAAPGQIIAIIRDQFDRSCTFNSNLWNAVYVQHADGSVAVYGHMKKNSPTSKSVGDTVALGEYLGIIGSSGNSTGPHLHFEVYSEIEWNGVGQDVLIDPYAGSCNTMNTESWWADQKPYHDPNINAVLTHDAPPEFGECSEQEVTHERNAFQPGEQVYLATYLRDQKTGGKLDLTILRPNGSVYQSWSSNLTANYTASYWYWSFFAPSTLGQWTFRVGYEGQVAEHQFSIGTLSVEDTDFQTTYIFPNPAKTSVTVKSSSPIKKYSITNVLGKTILNRTNSEEHGTTIDLGNLTKGLYFLTLEGDNNQKKTIKLIKD